MVKQSAERLDVQKNVLRIGFDSSTEKRAFFNASDQKKEVAPLAVKNRNAASHRGQIISQTEPLWTSVVPRVVVQRGRNYRIVVILSEA
jgi:hypothetical protein